MAESIISKNIRGVFSIRETLLEQATKFLLSVVAGFVIGSVFWYTNEAQGGMDVHTSKLMGLSIGSMTFSLFLTITSDVKRLSYVSPNTLYFVSIVYFLGLTLALALGHLDSVRYINSTLWNMLASYSLITIGVIHLSQALIVIRGYRRANPLYAYSYSRQLEGFYLGALIFLIALVSSYLALLVDKKSVDTIFIMLCELGVMVYFFLLSVIVFIFNIEVPMLLLLLAAFSIAAGAFLVCKNSITAYSQSMNQLGEDEETTDSLKT